MRDFGINDLRSIAPDGCTVIKLGDDSRALFAITFSDGSSLIGMSFDHAALALRAEADREDGDDDDDDTLTDSDISSLRETYRRLTQISEELAHARWEQGIDTAYPYATPPLQHYIDGIGICDVDTHGNVWSPSGRKLIGLGRV